MREWIQQVIAVHATNGYHVRKIDKEAIAISVKQSTGPAFENHALNNIYDPVHNIAAGVGCAVNRDRSVGNMPDVLAVRAGLLNVPH